MDGIVGPDRPDNPDGQLRAAENDRSVGRIFSLTDAVFAIAMTLLALDLKVPDVGEQPTDSALRHALGAQSSTYVAFLLSFYVIATYWRRHHRLMRTVRASDRALLRRTILLLLAISAMPFTSELLGNYSTAIAVTVYALVNALALAALLLIDYELAARGLSTDGKASGTAHEMWCDFVAFLLAVPAAYLIPGHGLIALIGLLVISGAAGRIIGRRLAKRPAAAGPAPAEPMASQPTPAVNLLPHQETTTAAGRNRSRRFGSGSVGIDRPRRHRS
ncbi:putative membrane protein [Nakamurella sp. UYEF19]|uniref:TMEM175 family protein n=1 Tax=Nakamurella sp. UYEF19 TaxID=1756392 RepID=UPI003396F0B0